MFGKKTEPTPANLNKQEVLHKFSFELPPELAAAWGLTTMGSGPVTRSELLSVPACVSGLNLTAGTLSTLPLDVTGSNRKRVRSPLLDQLDPERPNVITLRRLAEDMAIEGIGALQVLSFDARNFPVNVKHIPYGKWNVDKNTGVVSVDGKVVPSNTVKFFESPVPALRVSAARAVRTAVAAEEAAYRMAKSPVPYGIFKTVGEVDPDPADVGAFLAKFETARGKNSFGATPRNLEFQQLSMNADDMALTELRNLASIEIARVFTLSPEWIGTSTTSRTYQNAEQQRRDLVDLSLMSSLMHAIEQRFSMPDMTPRGQQVRFNLDAFLRSDTKTRFESHKIAVDGGWRTVEEVREIEDLPSLPKDASNGQ